MNDQTQLLKLLNDVRLFEPETKNKGALVSGADRTYKALYALNAFFEEDKTVFFVLGDEYEAKRFYKELSKYLDEEQLIYYPRETLYFTYADAVSQELSALRARAVRAAAKKEKKLIVTSVWALCERRAFYGINEIIKYTLGQSVSFEKFISRLSSYGYERTDLCEASGQFSVRGGIIDYFPMGSTEPLRIEFFGDEIDSIRVFDPVTQTSLRSCEGFELSAFGEASLSKKDLEVSLDRFRSLAQEYLNASSDEMKSSEEFNELMEKLEENPRENARLLYMYSGKPLKSIFELFKNKRVILVEPSLMEAGYESAFAAVRGHFQALLEKGLAFAPQLEVFLSYQNLCDMINDCSWQALCSIEQASAFSYSSKVNAGCADVSFSKSQLALFCKQLPVYQANGYKIIFTYSEDHERESLSALLSSLGISLRTKEENGAVSARKTLLFHGFDYFTGKALVLPVPAIRSGEAEKEKLNSKRKTDAFFSDIKPGDYVVHDYHGIGRYEGISKIELDGVGRDYIKVIYSGDSVLYVPTDQMDVIQKYIGPSDASPKLSSMGASDWAGTKSKVSKAVKALAEEYVKMYAMRQSLTGYAFSPDTLWQGEFEAAFEFEPTPGQLKASEEIKNDMQKPLPMDRLLCGDVGYGKTEVAMRAAFKAVMDSKQVAVLVPTTILALQHYNNFVSRFSKYPVKIEMLSRFRTSLQAQRIADELERGKIDIIIGTHKLLSKNIHFRDLGLLIVDEEQRFGVAHKDRLKLMKQDVDTLTLSATPIPRTLHMSLTGIRDMSVLDTPPANKAEIKTYVMPTDDRVIADAIRFELSRGGQVFYVVNRISGIERETERIRFLVPGATVNYAHGQMSEKELEDRILGFMNRSIDVLVCTVLIENGVDFTNANTIIIMNSDFFGLSQLYQLRGRVGRSDAQAFAYMMYSENKTLSEIASKRLAAIKEFTRFGSGFKIAMRDLQLRGAGDILGASQHGHFANVGYEMYCRLLGEAVGEQLGVKSEKPSETEIDIKTDLYIPNDYVPSEEQRIELYKTIAFIRNEEDFDRTLEEIIDRYGDVPSCVMGLMKVAILKSKASKLKIKKIRQLNDTVVIDFQPDAFIPPEVITSVSTKYNAKLKGGAAFTQMVVLGLNKGEILSAADEIISKMLEIIDK